MDFQEAKDEFAIRYYRWASVYLQREFEEDFPLLRMIKSGTVLSYLEYLKNRPRDEQYAIATALQKRCHRRALELAGQKLTASEEKMISEYLEKGALTLTPFEESIWDRRLDGKGPVKKLTRGRFIKQASQELSLLSIPLEKNRRDADLIGRIRVGVWTVNFTFFLGQPPRIEHYISHDLYFTLKERIHVLSWLGISSGLIWDLLITDEDGNEAAKSMRIATAGFLEAAPALLDGLTADSNLASK